MAIRIAGQLVKQTREDCAQLVEAMIQMDPWKEQMWSRGALMIAARAIRRGRHFTNAEKMAHFHDAIFPAKPNRKKRDA